MPELAPREQQKVNEQLRQHAHEKNQQGILQALEHGADVHAKNNDGQTPLHHATWNGHKETVELLLKHGANIHATDTDGRTPEQTARQLGFRELAELIANCVHTPLLLRPAEAPENHGGKNLLRPAGLTETPEEKLLRPSDEGKRPPGGQDEPRKPKRGWRLWKR
ncbi:ankyrin repeat domain-containing protein [Candidatus Micrarchaeota archaeon]|nr:ankyrin repeat domain-containing protein [Candidatus Micrarchaeota archaeon]